MLRTCSLNWVKLEATVMPKGFIRILKNNQQSFPNLSPIRLHKDLADVLFKYRHNTLSTAVLKISQTWETLQVLSSLKKMKESSLKIHNVSTTTTTYPKKFQSTKLCLYSQPLPMVLSHRYEEQQNIMLLANCDPVPVLHIGVFFICVN